jgi:hypothetical protein
MCIGLDGWLLKQVHLGMTPANNLWEVAQGILFAPICRFIALFYIIGNIHICIYIHIYMMHSEIHMYI